MTKSEQEHIWYKEFQRGWRHIRDGMEATGVSFMDRFNMQGNAWREFQRRKRAAVADGLTAAMVRSCVKDLK